MKAAKLIVALGVVALILGVIFWRSRKSELPPPISASITNQPTPAAEPVAQETGSLEARLRALQISLQSDASSRNENFGALRQMLTQASVTNAAASIRALLDTKLDAPTGQGFKVGGKGGLDQAPTFRTYLMDYLAQIDPSAAAAYARVVLSSMDSPDEWAVALRNLARGDTSAAARDLLTQKTAELLAYEPWQQNPSTGYLEAFDTAVYLGGTNLVPTLTDLVRKKDNQAVAHAAYLALDRLVIADAPALLSALETQPDLMQGREQTRANYFARADVRDPRQREIVESYLINPKISSGELAQFAGLYPSANFMISANLLTPTPTPSHADLTSRDAESLRVVNEWLNDPRFATVRPQLEKTKQRLEEFVRQAGK